jgi:dynein assembly factor 1
VETLYLECCGFNKIENLKPVMLVTKLYLQENLIEKMEGLGTLSHLRALNLSDNCLKKIECLDTLSKLDELQVARNYLKTADDVRHLLQCPSLKELDLEGNILEDGPGILEILEQLPLLRCLRLKGNPMVRASNMRHYRKLVLSKLPLLEYLDDRPVFDSERVRVKAWAKYLRAHPNDFKGAQQAEREAVAVDAEIKQQKLSDSHNFLGGMVQGWQAAEVTGSILGADSNGSATTSSNGSIFMSDGGFSASLPSSELAPSKELEAQRLKEERRRANKEEIRLARERERERFLNPRSVEEEVAGCKAAERELSSFDPIWYSFYDQQPIDKPEGWDRLSEKQMGRGGAVGPVVIVDEAESREAMEPNRVVDSGSSAGSNASARMEEVGMKRHIKLELPDRSFTDMEELD